MRAIPPDNSTTADDSAELGFPEYKEAWKSLNRPRTDTTRDPKEKLNCLQAGLTDLMVKLRTILKKYGFEADTSLTQEELKEQFCDIAQRMEPRNDDYHSVMFDFYVIL